ncbi:hypothetical protein RND81_11G121700 [Saponaria officinalis]|uniref:Gnk2-homologous domain-containing protein n=1 Tax=Saponaria officinalis TaxID=3572 RepID=A0AAW1HL62_SAPOF
MATTLVPFFSLTLLTFLLSTFPTSSDSSALKTFVYGGCSHLKFSSEDTSYMANLNALLTSLVNSATYSSYNHFTVVGTSPHDVVYGLYQCCGDLSMPDCASCIVHSVNQVGSLCPGSCGGVVQLQGCFIKFDNDTFLGVEDKAVVYKKCGPTKNDMTTRDAMLDGMVTGGGGLYREGGSKDVAAIAQCVGDLSGGECQDCLEEAIKQLKVACGTASYGDMYLGKCYVRYTIGGGRGFFNSDGSEKNRGVKTFALIVGLLAAIAILIIFLTFLCRAFGGSSK